MSAWRIILAAQEPAATRLHKQNPPARVPRSNERFMGLLRLCSLGWQWRWRTYLRSVGFAAFSREGCRVFSLQTSVSSTVFSLRCLRVVFLSLIKDSCQKRGFQFKTCQNGEFKGQPGLSIANSFNRTDATLKESG